MLCSHFTKNCPDYEKVIHASNKKPDAICFHHLVNLGKFPLKQGLFKFFHVDHHKIVARDNGVKSCCSGPQECIIS